MPLRIIFMGTPDFAVPSLERLVANDFKPAAVVTAPDRPRGRGQKLAPSPVKLAAEAYAIRVLQPESLREEGFLEELRALTPDVMVVVAFKILPPEVFALPRKGAFNLHASLLPKFRGAAPINRAIMAGETETGVTTFFLKEKVDVGDMILQWRVDIGPDETAGELHDRLMELGAEAVLETVRLIDAGLAVSTPQQEAGATPAPKLFKEDGRIAWHRPAARVHNQVRGLSPYPGAWTMHEGTMLKVYRTTIAEGSEAAGTVLEAGPRLVVACGEDAVEILTVQQEGRKTLDAHDFLRGYPVRVGERFE